MNKICAVCGSSNNIHIHHIIFGKNRKKADEDKLVIPLCYEHHEGMHGVHGKYGSELDLKLKKEAEIKWLLQDYDRSINDFIKRYGKNYL